MLTAVASLKPTNPLSVSYCSRTRQSEKQIQRDYSVKAKIIELVCVFFNIDHSVLKIVSRKREIVFPRQMCMTLLHRFTKISLKSIGEEFGGKDHTTVIHAKQTIKDLIDTDEKVRLQFTTLCAQINSHKLDAMVEQEETSNGTRYLTRNVFKSWYLETISDNSPVDFSKLRAKDMARIVGRRNVLSGHGPICVGVKCLFSDWDQDMVSMNEADFLTEFEIIQYRTEFMPETKKRKFAMYDERRPGKVPNYLYFVCPEDMISLDEVPKFAGLIYINSAGSYITVKRAPKLHSFKFDRKNFTKKVARIYSERQFLGCSMLRYKNQVAEETAIQNTLRVAQQSNQAVYN